MPDTLTVADCVAAAARRLAAAGVGEAPREAAQLWAGAAGITVGEGWLARETAPDEQVVRRFEAAVARRVGGEPLAYVLGHWSFRHLELIVDRRVLIPRPETELLVDLALARVRDGRACDVGTGSGCLGLALAQEGRFERVLLTDRSRDALAVAARNAAALGLNVSLVRGDLLTALAPASLDLVVGNPPYLTDGEWASLDPSVRDWEPASALASGADGMQHTTALLRDARRVLRHGGWIALEVDDSRAGVAATVARAMGWDDVTMHPDLFGRTRFLTARRSPA